VQNLPYPDDVEENLMYSFLESKENLEENLMHSFLESKENVFKNLMFLILYAYKFVSFILYRKGYYF
jgi:hypothetical protein